MLKGKTTEEGHHLYGLFMDFPEATALALLDAEHWIRWIFALVQQGSCILSMTSTRDMARTAIILWAICLFTSSDGKALMKRSVSEMQIMHDFGEHLHSADRQNWLLEKLQTVHHEGQPAEEAAVDAKPREARSWRLMPDHLQTKIQKKQKDWNKAYRSATSKTKPQ